MLQTKYTYKLQTLLGLPLRYAAYLRYLHNLCQGDGDKDVCIHVCTLICITIYLYRHTHYTLTNIYKTHVRTNSRSKTHTHIYVQIRTHTHTYTHAHKHTQRQTNRQIDNAQTDRQINTHVSRIHNNRLRCSPSRDLSPGDSRVRIIKVFSGSEFDIRSRGDGGDKEVIKETFSSGPQ